MIEGNFDRRVYMSTSRLIQNLPSLASIIDRQPLTVDPDMLLVEVMGLMSQAKGRKCLLPSSNLTSSNLNSEDSSGTHTPEPDVSINVPHSSVLVSVARRLVGVFTERDLVRLTASQQNLEGIKVSEVMNSTPVTLVLADHHTVINVLSIFQQHQIRLLPLLDEQDKIVGIVTPEHIRQILQPVNLLKFRSVSEGMTSEVITATLTTSILRVAQIMTERNVSSVVILDKQQLPLGIVTEQDIVQFQVLELNLDQLLAQSVMSSPLFCLQPADSLWSAQQIMQAKNIRRLVITNEQGTLQGILTQSNLLQLLDPLEMLCLIEKLQEQMLQRTAELEKSNLELRLEVIRRQQIEDDLEQRVIERTTELAMRTQELQAEIDKYQFQKQERERFLVVASDLQVILGSNGYFHWVSPKFESTLGWTAEEMTSAQWTEFLYPDDITLSVAEEASVFSGNETVAFENRYRHKDGSYRWFLWSAHSYPEERVIYAVAVDITERKAAEQKIQEQAALLDIATDAIVVRDLESQIQFWNKGAESIYGWSAAEAIGSSTNQLFYPKNSLEPVVAEALATVIATGSWQGELHKITKAGQPRVIQSRWTLVRDETGHPRSILSVDTDVTDKQMLEQQFLRAQRLESLGTLASGIAHDLNNVLTPIMGAAQLLPHTLKNLDERNQRLLNMLVDNSKRGSNLVKQILTFARGMDGERTVLQVRHILTEIISVARQTFPRSINISLDVPSEELWLVSADATQIHQVLMNLFVNARDAMPDGGDISVTVENIVISGAYAKLHLQPEIGSYVVITIGDTGIGMNSEMLDRIFDPFFTTKETGTGLGLSTVVGIVKAHGGAINVYSEMGRGSCFKIYLPAVDSPEAEAQISISKLYDGQKKMVLVVDDEISIRVITTESLQAYNYNVMEASDGVEAIALYAKHYEEIDVVLIDMMMPNLDTPSTIRALRRIEPAVKIVAMSGLATNQEAVKSSRVTYFLTKPFTTEEMLQTLGNILQE
jgi:PAS domain S-box-containing protein